MGFDPDFIVMVDGTNYTKYVHKWVLMDKEGGEEGGGASSTLDVTLKNPDQILSNKFDTGQKLQIIFGYFEGASETATFKLKKVTEAYSVAESHDFINIVGYDALDDLTKGTMQSGGQEAIEEE